MHIESGQAETKCFRKIKDCLDRNLRHARPSDEQHVKIWTSSTWNVVRYHAPRVWKHVWPRTEWTSGDWDCKILPPRTKLTWQTIIIGKGSCSKRPLQCWCNSPNLLNMIFLQHWRGRASKRPNSSSIPKPIVLNGFHRQVNFVRAWQPYIFITNNLIHFHTLGTVLVIMLTTYACHEIVLVHTVLASFNIEEGSATFNNDHVRHALRISEIFWLGW